MPNEIEEKMSSQEELACTIFFNEVLSVCIRRFGGALINSLIISEMQGHVSRLEACYKKALPTGALKDVVLTVKSKNANSC